MNGFGLVLVSASLLGKIFTKNQCDGLCNMTNVFALCALVGVCALIRARAAGAGSGAGSHALS